MTKKPFNIVILISGRGTNLQALINASSRSTYQISAVISNNANARGLKKAERYGIDTFIIEHKAFDSKVAFEKSLAAKIREINPSLIVLAGFMRVLGPKFIRLFRGKIINIHPSLLPKYPGLNTHQRVLEDNEGIHGVTVHFVTEELDGGQIIAQDSVPVLSNDTAETLAARVLEKEHILYPKVIESLAAGKIRMESEYA